MATKAPAVQAMSKDRYPQTGSRAGVVLHRPPSSSSRLILDLFAEEPCGAAEGVSDDVISRVPEELAAKGVTQEQWTLWMGRLREALNKHNMSANLSYFLMCLVVPAPIACYYNGMKHVDIDKWAKEMNTELMEPLGMYLKTQGSTACYLQDIQTGFSPEFCQWLAIALTPEDVEALKQDNNNFCGCGGKRHVPCPCYTVCCQYTCLCGCDPRF